MINPDAGSGAAVDRITPRGEAHHRLLGIQAGRGFAALLVVFYHATKMISLPQYAGHEPLHGFFQFGHAGVDFFFVLSGFIITYVHYDDVGQPNRLGRYVWRRLTRIYPIYWVATAIAVAMAVSSASGSHYLGAGHVLASLLLIPHGRDPVLGVAWSLEHEMLFYAAFALVILQRRLWPLLIGSAVLIVAFGQLTAPSSYMAEFLASPYHLEFLMGIGAAALLRRGAVPAPRTLAVGGALAFFATGMVENAGLLPWAGFVISMLFGMASTAVIGGVAAAESAGSLRIGRLGTLFGAASYSIYLVHTMGIGLGLRVGAMLGLYRLVPDWLMLALVSAIAVTAALLLYWFVERPMLTGLRRVGRLAAARRSIRLSVREAVPSTAEPIDSGSRYQVE